MTAKPIIKTVSIDKIINPWGGEERIKKELDNARKNFLQNPRTFACKKCGTDYDPKPSEPIYYNLCDLCFKEFDTQKQEGRRATLRSKDGTIKHFEDVSEWIKNFLT